MQQAFHSLIIETRGKGLTSLTTPIHNWVKLSSISNGLLTIWCRHTSASLIVQENADPTVQRDLEAFFDDLVREDQPYRHDYEGPDDMPAHIRTTLTNVSLTLPVKNGEAVLGLWQGIYLFEHRHFPHRREVVLHLLGS